MSPCLSFRAMFTAPCHLCELGYSILVLHPIPVWEGIAPLLSQSPFRRAGHINSPCFLWHRCRSLKTGSLLVSAASSSFSILHEALPALSSSVRCLGLDTSSNPLPYFSPRIPCSDTSWRKPSRPPLFTLTSTLYLLTSFDRIVYVSVERDEMVLLCIHNLGRIIGPQEYAECIDPDY